MKIEFCFGILFLIKLSFAQEGLVIFMQSGQQIFEKQYIQTDHVSLSAVGMRQQYLLGKYYKKKFYDIFGERLNVSNVKILSSFKPNSQIGIQNFMNGVYDVHSFTDEIKVKKDYFQPQWKDFDIEVDFKEPLPKGIQQTPFHSTMLPDFYFGTFNKENCPMLKDDFHQIKEKFFTIQQKGESLVNYTEQFVSFKEILPNGITDIDDVKKAFDFIIIQQHLGEIKLEKQLYQKWLYLKSAWIFVKYYRNRNFMKFHLTQLLKDVQNFIEKLNNSKDVNEKKVFIIQAEEINLYTYLSLFQNNNLDCLIRKIDNVDDQEDCAHATLPSSSIAWYFKDKNIQYFINGKETLFCEDRNCDYMKFKSKIKQFKLTGENREQVAYYCDSRFAYLGAFWTKFFFSFTLFFIIFLIWLIYKQTNTKQL